MSQILINNLLTSTWRVYFNSVLFIITSLLEMYLSVIQSLYLLCVSPSLPLTTPLPSKVTVPPQRPLLCPAGPPTDRQMEWNGTGLPFSQAHFLTALCSSPVFNFPIVNLFSFTPLLPRAPTLMVVVVGRPFGQHPCCKVLHGKHAACCVCVSECFTMPLQMKLSDLGPLICPQI